MLALRGYYTPDPLLVLAVRSKRVGPSCLAWRGENFNAARRCAYELAFGPLTGGRELRATCGVPACINPWHVEERRVGVRTGELEFCVHGHDISDNASVYWQKTNRGTRIRVCKACTNETRARYRARLRERAAPQAWSSASSSVSY